MNINLQNTFLRNVLSLSGATAVAHIFNSANFIVIITLYSQQVVGEYSVFTAYAAIGGSVVLGSYHLSLPNIEDSKEALLMVYSLVSIAVILSALLAFIFYIFGYEYWYYFSIALFSAALMSISDNVANRKQRYSYMAISKLVSPLLFAVFYWSFSLYSMSEDGLIAAQTFALFVVSAGYGILSIKLLGASGSFEFKKIKALLIRNRQFPLYVTPSQLFNMLAYQAPIIIIDRYFGAAVAAQYNLTLKLCTTPISVAGNAISQVYHGKVAEWVRSGAVEFYTKFRKMSGIFVLCGLLIGCGIFYLSTNIVFIFGEEWREAVDIAKILSPLYAAMFVVLPFGASFYVFEQQKYVFHNQFWSCVVSVVAFYVGVFIGDVTVGIAIFSSMTVVRYVFIWIKLKQLHRLYSI